IWPLLSGSPGATSPHKAFLYYKMDTLECVRSGRWKLRVAMRGRKPDQEKRFTPELYDLDADIGESHNVALEHPQDVARLQKIASDARSDLGDRGQPGKNQRPAGMVTEARGLTDPAP
ncbi:MAG: arylsulfatase, partial [Planctomycetaceae bacterium]